MAAKRVLVLYHSLTGRTEAVIHRIDVALRERGHVTDVQRILAREPWEFPLSRSRFLWRNAQCWVGMDMSMPILPLDLSGPYDHVVLGTQTWHLNPAFPVTTFLDSEDAEILRGLRVTPVLTCRNRHRQAMEILTRKILQRGGRVAAPYILSDAPRHLKSTLFYLFNGHDPMPGSYFDGKTGRPFDFDSADLETASTFGRALAQQLAEGDVPVPGVPMIINDQEG